MKYHLFLIPTVLMFSVPAMAADEATGQPRDKSDITVQFSEPENFTDFATTQAGGRRDSEALAESFREDVKEVVERYLPPGFDMKLRFTDINLAGEFEPEQGPEYMGVRIIRGIYPPSFVVEYEIQNPEGEVVARGHRRETDLAFQNIVSFRTDERLFYETELVEDFMRDVTRSLDVAS